ncbi:MAG: fructose 1,6-bisphosphatase, partial [Candidatus Aenigmarchaeota archaeon]|nr:fructose 1,6-bisphosphatase [Candidatus Aenigmarchaeota archaeon]
MKVTISAIKADIGGFVGHSSVHPKLIELANRELEKAKERGIIIDYYVGYAGDDLELVMTHEHGVESEVVHRLAWETFKKGTELAKKLKLYGAGQDLLKDAFAGTIKGMGPGFAEMEITERKSEPIVVFAMDKTEPGAFNYPLFRIFADPFNTAGLVIDPKMHNGFRFEVWDIMENKRVFLDTPEEIYDLLALIGAKSRYVIKRVYPKEHPTLPKDEPAAVVSTEKLSLIAGKYIGKDDPVAIVRAQSGLPALGEVLEPFSFPYLVSGWMRGSHNGPIMPCSFKQAKATRFDGPPIVVAMGFQVSNGELIGPNDLFDSPVFEETRKKCAEIADYIRKHGPFEPHRLPMEDMEYT